MFRYSERALTGAINYYRAVNESEELYKLRYRKINVTTLILWGQKDAFYTSPHCEIQPGMARVINATVPTFNLE
ncbi:hypothetical protein MTO96_039493 [Rhipicephalus appendiculatus]